MPFNLNACFRSNKKRQRTNKAKPHLINAYIDRISIIESVPSVSRSHSYCSITSAVIEKRESHAYEFNPLVVEEPVLNEDTILIGQPTKQNSTASNSVEQVEYTCNSSLDQSENVSKSEESLVEDRTKLTSDEGTENLSNSSLYESVNDSHSSLDARYTLLSSSSVAGENVESKTHLKHSDSIEFDKNVILKKHRDERDLQCLAEKCSFTSTDPPNVLHNTKCSSENFKPPTQFINPDSVKSMTNQEVDVPSNEAYNFKTIMSVCSVEIIELKLEPHFAIEVNQEPEVIIRNNEMIRCNSEKSPELCQSQEEPAISSHDLNVSQSRWTEGTMWSTELDDNGSEESEIGSKFLESHTNNELKEDVTFEGSTLSEAVKRPVELIYDDNYSAGDSMIEEIKEGDIAISPRSNCTENDQCVFDLDDGLKNTNFAITPPETEIIGISLSNVMNDEQAARKDEELRDQFEDSIPTECSGDYATIISESINKTMTCRMAEQLSQTAYKTLANESTEINDQNSTDSSLMINPEKKRSMKQKRARNVLHSFLNLQNFKDPQQENIVNTKSLLLKENSKLDSDINPYINLTEENISTDATSLILPILIQGHINSEELDCKSQELTRTVKSSTLKQIESGTPIENIEETKTNYTNNSELVLSELNDIDEASVTKYQKKEKCRTQKSKVIDQVIKSVQFITEQRGINSEANVNIKTKQLETIDADTYSCLDELISQSIENAKQIILLDKSECNNTIISHNVNTNLLQENHNTEFLRRDIKLKIQCLMTQAIEYCHTNKVNRFEKDSRIHKFQLKGCEKDIDKIITNSTSNNDSYATFSMSPLNISEIPVESESNIENIETVLHNSMINQNAIIINNMPTVPIQDTVNSGRDSDINKDFESYDASLELGKHLEESLLPEESENDTVSSHYNSSDEVNTSVKSSKNTPTEVKVQIGNKEAIINVTSKKCDTAMKCSEDTIIVREDLISCLQTSSPITIHLTKRSPQRQKNLKTKPTIDSQGIPTIDDQKRPPFLLSISRFEERKKNLEAYNNQRSEALKPMKRQKRKIPIKRSDSFEFTLSSLGKKFTTYVDPFGRKSPNLKIPRTPELHLHMYPGQTEREESARSTAANTEANNNAALNSDLRYVYSPTSYRSYRKQRSGDVFHASSSCKRIGRVLDASKAIRSPKYPSNIAHIVSPNDERAPGKFFLNTTKPLLEQEHNIESSHELGPKLRNVLNNPQFVDKRTDFEPILIDPNTLKSAKAISPENLRTLFDEKFRRYAKRGRNAGDLISHKRSTEWLTDAGIIDGILTAEKASSIFKETAGVKVALNKRDYREFLYKLTRLKRINYNDIYERLCGIDNELS